MQLDWKAIDRWIFGEAWTGSKVGEHAGVLCEEIGPRWASSEGEKKARQINAGSFEYHSRVSSALGSCRI
jgi:hypothetical protein